MPKRRFSRLPSTFRLTLFVAPFLISTAHAAGVAGKSRDMFDHLIDANEAQIVMLVERQRIDDRLAELDKAFARVARR